MEYKFVQEAFGRIKNRADLVRRIEIMGKAIIEMADVIVPATFPHISESGIKVSFTLTPDDEPIIEVMQHLLPCEKSD